VQQQETYLVQLVEYLRGRGLVFSKPTEKAPNLKYNFRPNISNCFVMGEGE
jgi:hypothetical protein